MFVYIFRFPYIKKKINYLPNFMKNKVFKRNIFSPLSCSSSFYSQTKSFCVHSGDNTSSELRTLNKYVNFDDILSFRRAEARRSFLVQVFSEQSYGELYEYCNKIAPIRSMHHYHTSKKEHYILVEFNNESTEDLLKACSPMDQSEAVPVNSQMLWFKASSKMKSKVVNPPNDVPLFVRSDAISQEEFVNLMSVAESVSDQINILYQVTKLDEIGIRLRFLTAYQLERALLGMFPNCHVLPFGSSVNGFGKMGCDLDLVLHYDNSPKKESRLVFQGKGVRSNERVQTQRHMELLADLLHLFLPGCSNVRRILQARVPIVKYSQEYTGIDCDLSMSNFSAVYMSELLFLYGSLDERVRPLVFTVKYWAYSVGLTSSSPGKWITNFSLTWLVIFYLQRLSVLPSLDTLIKLARPEDKRYSEEVNCTFIRDVTGIPKGTNSSPLHDILMGFFDFYANFDFQTKGVSICSGNIINKPDYAPLYIMNPLERSLNVSKNVSAEEVERLKVESRNATWALEIYEHNPSPTLWGLLQLFKPLFQYHPSQKQVYYINSKTGKRMLAVKDLFHSVR